MRFDLLINEMACAAVLGDAIDICLDAWRPPSHPRRGESRGMGTAGAG